MLRGLRRLRRIGRRLVERNRPVILMYHRVAEVHPDPWTLAVRPDRFAAQIEALTRVRHVVPLSWLVGQLRRGRAPRKTAAVTFDDGYADLLSEAHPVLKRHACPATVFITTGAIGRAEPFWWDDLVHIMLGPGALPSRLELEIDGRRRSWPVANGGRAADDRAALLLAVWRALRPLDPDVRGAQLAYLAGWAGATRLQASRSRALGPEEVVRLAEPGFIDIGAHSVTHRPMPLLEPRQREIELEESRRTCEALAGVPIEGFAYPFGELDEASVADVRGAGFVHACTTAHGVLHPGSDPLRLPRLAIADWEVDRFVRLLNGITA